MTAPLLWLLPGPSSEGFLFAFIIRGVFLLMMVPPLFLFSYSSLFLSPSLFLFSFSISIPVALNGDGLIEVKPRVFSVEFGEIGWPFVAVRGCRSAWQCKWGENCARIIQVGFVYFFLDN